VSTPHLFPVRVYWEDTDAGGVVYHTSYLRFMERGRTEVLRALGIGQQELLRETGLAFVVHRMEVDFLKSAVLDDLLTVETNVAIVHGASMRLDQKVLRGETVLIRASVTVACVRDGRPARIPADIKAKLSGG